jgi:UDP-N-acetylglucosamine 1-carboxyvinyltransferase
VDIHIRGLKALGAQVNTEEGNVIAEAKELIGTEIPLGGKFGSTVLGTDNIMMAATLARGKTIIESAACEPEVTDLANFLIAMGAKITGQGTRRLEIEGVSALHGAEHTVIPDRIEAGTFVVAGLITEGDITIHNIVTDHLADVLDRLRSAGAQLEASGTSLRVHTPDRINSFNVTTETYPGFPTDMQAQFCALASICPGLSVITDKVFPNRFMHISEMKRMGADIQLEGSTAIIKSVDYLSGAPVMASDLRASAALVLAGLVARGATEVNRVYHIDRGYEHIDQKLRGLGAQIERIA